MSDNRFNIVRTDAEIECPVLDKALRDMGAELVLIPDSTSEETFVTAMADADLLLMCYRPITAEVLQAAPRLRGIVKYGVGIDAIDLACARKLGIPVANIPDYANETVAEGAFCLLLALAKKLVALDRVMQRDAWAWPQPQWMGLDIAGKTLGLVGYGQIGQRMARMASGFRVRVIAYDPAIDASSMQAAGVERYADLPPLLAEADFVSLHCVLTPETRHLIGASELIRMKSTALLVNSSRGALVDELALVEALKQQQIAGAALDVFSQEPLDQLEHPLRDLYTMDNVILSPHMTFYTREAMDRLEADTLARCKELMNGQSVLVKSKDPRLQLQTRGVRFE